MRAATGAGIGFLVMVGALGCGRVTPAPSGIPLASAPTEIAQSVCPKAYSCCTAAQLMGNDMAGADEPSCEMATAAAFQKQLSAVETSQEDGRSRYDGDQLDACLTYIRSSTCEMLGVTNHFAGIPGCGNFVQSLVADGGACVYDWECTGGKCQDASCQSLPAPGAACPDQTCAAGAACDPSGACVAILTDGASCAEATQCPSGMCTGGTCAPTTSACFYASGCSVAGGGAGAGGLALVLLAGAWLMAPGRRRRSWRRRSRPAR